MNIECSQCGSNEFTKLSLVYAQGVSDLNAHSRGWGLIFGSAGADFGFGKFRTKGEIQTRLSQKASPPRKWSYWKIVFWGLIGLLVLDFTLGYADSFLRVGENFNQQLASFWYSYLGVVALALCLAFWHNLRVVPNRYRIWDRSFMCRRCGHILQLPETRDSARQALSGEVQP